jgi:hypothetical protein
MRTAKQITTEAVETLGRLALEAAASSHHGLAGFLNKQSSHTHYGAPCRDHAKPTAEESEWHPELKLAASMEALA